MTLLRRTSGLLHLDTFDTDGDPGSAYTQERGTWAVESGVLVLTTDASTPGANGTANRLRLAAISTLETVVEWDATYTVEGEIMGALHQAAAGAHSNAFEHWATPDKVGLEITGQWTQVTSGTRAAITTTFGSDYSLPISTLVRQKAAIRSGGSTVQVDSRTKYWYASNAASSTTALILGPHDSSTGPTVAGSPGLMCVADAGSFSVARLAVYRSLFLRVESLTGTQGFVIRDGADALIALSGQQGGGVASVNTGPLGALPLTGYVQVVADGSNASSAVVADGRYPASGTASLWGGDVFSTPIPEDEWPTFGAHWNPSGTGTFPTKWTQANSDLGAYLCPSIRWTRTTPTPQARPEILELALDDPDGEMIPGYAAGPHYPNVLLGREVRLFGTYTTGIAPFFYGRIRDIRWRGEFPRYQTILIVHSPLAEILNLRIALYLNQGVIHNPADRASFLTQLFDKAVDAGFSLPDAYRSFDTDLSPIRGADGIGNPYDVYAYEFTVAEHLRWAYWQSGGLLLCEPLYRTSAGEGDFRLRWVSRASLLAAAAALTWDSEAGDFHVPTDARYEQRLERNTLPPGPAILITPDFALATGS